MICNETIVRFDIAFKISEKGVEVMTVNEKKEVSEGISVSVEMVDGEIRRFILSGATKDYPSREDVKEMLNHIYETTSGFFGANGNGGVAGAGVI